MAARMPFDALFSDSSFHAWKQIASLEDPDALGPSSAVGLNPEAKTFSEVFNTKDLKAGEFRKVHADRIVGNCFQRLGEKGRTCRHPAISFVDVLVDSCFSTPHLDAFWAD